MSTQFTAPVTSSLLTAEEAAGYLRANIRTLERRRTVGGGPSFVKIGHRVCYDLADLRAWVAQQRRAHTGEPAPASLHRGICSENSAAPANAVGGGWAGDGRREGR